MNEIIKASILKSLKENYPNFPSFIEESYEDNSTLYVYVLYVPDDQTWMIKEFIYNLGEKIEFKNKVILLQMVKNIKTSEEHYSKMRETKMSISELFTNRMTVDEYMNGVIELFKSGKATEQQWKDMAQAVCNESESDRTTTKSIDSVVDPVGTFGDMKD